MKRKWLLPLIVLVSLLIATPVLAIGMSGNFYRQDLVIKQGETIELDRVNLVVFNHDDEPMEYEMTTVTPEGISIQLDKWSGTIPPVSPTNPISCINVWVESISATKKAPVGEWFISISANAASDGNIGSAVEMTNTIVVEKKGKWHKGWYKRWLKRLVRRWRHIR